MVFDDAVKCIIDGLHSAGVLLGDVVLVHSDTDILGPLLDQSEPVERFRVLETALLESVGPEGTILVPTFTYSFCRGRSFDPERRNSATGMFTNYFRRRENAYRSLHPVFSFAAIGAKAKELTENVSKYGFGAGSVFDRLVTEDAKVVCFNVPFQQCCTFVHYIEEMHGVDYRYMKTFKGKIILGGEETEAEAVNYVRDLDRNVNSNFDAFADLLAVHKILRSAPILGGNIYLYTCRETFELGKKALTEKPYILLAAAPDEA
jgi:aminoglycoside 3-N-acetyltransferase